MATDTKYDKTTARMSTRMQVRTSFFNEKKSRRFVAPATRQLDSQTSIICKVLLAAKLDLQFLTSSRQQVGSLFLPVDQHVNQTEQTEKLKISSSEG
jgi:hypothetical protein